MYGTKRYSAFPAIPIARPCAGRARRVRSVLSCLKFGTGLGALTGTDTQLDIKKRITEKKPAHLTRTPRGGLHSHTTVERRARRADARPGDRIFAGTRTEPSDPTCPIPGAPQFQPRVTTGATAPSGVVCAHVHRHASRSLTTTPESHYTHTALRLL